LDRNGRLLAQSVLAKSVFARPGEVKDKGGTAACLSKVLDLSKQALYRKLDQDKHFVWLSRKIGDPKAKAITEKGLPGIFLTAEQDRYYPQGYLAGQLLGFTGMDGQGLEGLEKALEQRLKGRSLCSQVRRDALGRLLDEQVADLSSYSGQDVQLTLDIWLQGLVEQALAKAVKRFQGRYGASLIIQVPTGEILAWAQYPFFDPNDFQSYRPALWRNRPALDVFEPGSTIKPLLVAAALEEGVCSLTDHYFCEDGSWQRWGHTFEDTHPYQELSVKDIVKYSSNIGAAKIGLDLGVPRYHRYLQDLGLGQPTEIPLAGQARGILPDPGQWRQVRLATSSFGQGVGVTLLQLARAYLCLANAGRDQGLRLLKRPDQDRQSGQRVFSPATARSVQGVMHSVVAADGTGTRARVPGVSVGGKTGTSQKASPEGGYSDEYLAAFIAFFPAVSPKYLMLALVDEPQGNHFGGVVAAPIVREVIQKMAAGQDYLSPVRASDKGPQRPKVAKYRPVRDAEPSSWVSKGIMPDLKGRSLRQAVELAAKCGRLPKLKGQGQVVVKQDPAPGQDPGTGRWTLWLEQGT
jgi:cell division protein FtsI (penicillin-binding protein 3)